MADEIRVSEVSTAELMSSSPTVSSGPASVRGWAGEMEVEDRWGIGSMSTRSEGCAPGPDHHRFDLLRQSRSRRLHGSRRSLHRAGRRFLLCFKRTTISLTVPDLEPPTPPKSGPLNMSGPLTNMSGPFTTPRLSGERTSGPPRLQRVGGPQISGPISTPRVSGNFMNEAIDTNRTKNGDNKDVEDPTSPVVNCMGQVKNKKAMKNVKKQECNEMERFRRTKSQVPSSSPSLRKFSSCKWMQLLRSNSSSISPSTPGNTQQQPCGEGEIDLGRFSSVSGASDPAAAPFERLPSEKRPDKTCLLMQRHQQQQTTDTESNKRPDKTCLLMRRQQNSEPPIPANQLSTDPEKTSWRNLRATDNDDTDELLQAQLESDAEFRRIVAESEPVFRNLPRLKTKKTEAPKWLADEPALNRRQGSLLYNMKMSRSSTTTTTT